MNKRRVAIIGAGPVGLEAAVYALNCGFRVDVYEKGGVGQNMLLWGHVSLFSPWESNHSPLGAGMLREQYAGWVEPDSDAILTGREHVRRYLLPLTQLPQLAGAVHEGCEVVSIGRDTVLKTELIGSARRKDFPFRILLKDDQGRESLAFADVVIDASGVYDNANNLGSGGIPAPGELSCKSHIEYHIPDITGIDRERFAGKKTLLIGAGYSAATTACDFAELIKEQPGTELLWVVRGHRTEPIATIENDSLAGRAELTAKANALASRGLSRLQFRYGYGVEEVKYFSDRDAFEVTLKSADAVDKVNPDRIVANVGYGPDNSLYRELQVHECYASRGPMKLSAALMGESSADCLAQTSMGAETLRNPEPDFYIIGNKSYGRNPTFLLRVGLSQVVEVFSLITGDAELDLYHNPADKAEVAA